MKCIKCNKPIPEGRLKILPNAKECVGCSSTERNYVRPIISGKTTYSEVEVIKNKDTKDYLRRLDSKGRQGFGSMLYRASRNESNSPSASLKTNIRKLPEFSQEVYQNVLKEALDWLDHDKEYALQKIEKAYQNEQISGINRRYVKEIIETLKPSPKKEVKLKVNESVDEEILDAFKYWKQ